MRPAERDVPKGPLAVRWHAAELPDFRAGAVSLARVTVENAGTATWRAGVNLAYHWLDSLGNPIVWDGIRTPVDAPVPPGEQAVVDARIRAPFPPGPFRLAIDLVEEGRLWFAELGNALLESEHQVAPRIERRLAARSGDTEALAQQDEPLVPEHEAEAIAYLAPGIAPPPDWSRRVLDAHQEGYAIVAGSIDAETGFLRRNPRELEPYAPGAGRLPGFAHPLACPSIVKGVDADWTVDVAGLPAVLAPTDRWFGEPWTYDGRLTLRLRAR